MHPNDKFHRPPMGPALLDVIARLERDTGPDEVDLLARLQATIAAVETPIDRLFARYHGRSSGPQNSQEDIDHGHQSPASAFLCACALMR